MTSVFSRGVLVLLLASTSVARALPAYCDGADVKRFTAVIDPREAGGDTFTYRYRTLRSARPGSPTIIFIPGGPGDDAMGKVSVFHNNRLDRIPPHFGLILTDPRGVGCNADPRITEATFRNDVLAQDILSLVRAERLNPYYLHGLSAGTALALVTASLAEVTPALKPAAVILEGVIGHALTPGEPDVAFQKQWRRVFADLNPAVRAELRKPKPYGLDPATWGFGLPGLLMDDRDPAGRPRATARLLNSVLINKRHVTREIERLAGEARAPVPDAVARHYRQITCREFADDAYSENSDLAFDLIDGNLKPHRGSACEGVAFDRPYDAARFKITAPIYYVQGQLDPSTPIEQARYNFAAQTRARRTFVTVVDGGHHAFWALKTCARGIWTRIERGGRGLESVLKNCGVRTTVDRAAATTEN